MPWFRRLPPRPRAPWWQRLCAAVLLVVLGLVMLAAMVGLASALADGAMMPGSWQEKTAQAASVVAAVAGLGTLCGSAVQVGKGIDDWVLVVTAIALALLVPLAPVALLVVHAAPLGWGCYAVGLLLGTAWLVTGWWLDRLRG